MSAERSLPDVLPQQVRLSILGVRLKLIFIFTKYLLDQLMLFNY